MKPLAVVEHLDEVERRPAGLGSGSPQERPSMSASGSAWIEILDYSGEDSLGE